MPKTRLSRRSFLEAMGASAALVPLLGMDDEAKAAVPVRRRLVTAAWTNGFWRSELWPEGEGETYKLKKILSPLEPFKKHLLVIGGLVLQNFLDTKDKKTANAGAGHDAYPNIFVGHPMSAYADFFQQAGGDSVDQYLADRLNAGTPIKNLVLSGRPGSGYSNTISYKGANSAGNTPESNPQKVFTTLFQGRNLNPGEIDKSFLKRKSILDHVGGDLDKFAGRVGTADRAKIQQHVQAVRELEMQIEALSKGAQCAQPTLGGTGDYPGVLKAQAKLIAAAFRCDLTRVVSFTLEDCAGDFTMPWLGAEFAGKGDEYPDRTHHDMAHGRKSSAAHAARYTRIGQWYFENIAALAKELADSGEGGGSLLDSSIIAVSSPMQHNHTVLGIPFVIIGGSWYYKTNRFLKLGPWKGKNDAPLKPSETNDDGWWSQGNAEQGLLPHNGVLVSLCNAMGVPTTTFGPEKYGGEMPELRG